jgi:hypothetical protein
MSSNPESPTDPEILPSQEQQSHSIRRSVSFQDHSNPLKKSNNGIDHDDPMYFKKGVERGEEAPSIRSFASSSNISAKLRHRSNGSMTSTMSMPQSFRKQLQLKEQEPPKYLFYPWSRAYKWWFAFTVAWSLLTVFFETYAVAFLPGGRRASNDAASIIEYCFLTIFGIDILVNFNLAYTDQEDLVVVDRKKIFRNYIRCWFWIDLIGIFPFYLIILAARNEFGVDNEQTRNLELVRLLRLVRLHRVAHASALAQYSTKISLVWYTLTRNFGVALLWTHFAACMMFFIAVQHNFQDSWLEPAETDTIFELYVTSLYWSIVTFATGTFGMCLAHRNANRSYLFHAHV